MTRSDTKDVSFVLGIVTPLLSVDSYALDLSLSLTTLRGRGAEFIHVIVGPEAICDQVLQVFKGSIFVPESGVVRGVYGALQDGISYLIARCAVTHLTWINGDDILTLSFASVIKCARENPDRLVGGGVEWIGSRGESFGRVPSWPFTWGARFLFEAHIPPFTQQGMVFPSSLFSRLGGFDISYKLSADSVLWHKALVSGVRLRFLPEIVACYRIHLGQLSGQREQAQFERARWRQALTRTRAQVLSSIIFSILFRIWNLNVYVRRVGRGRRLFSRDAMRAGSFMWML